ncbi:MAG: deoxyhypusine synthase [Planctomycetes bacterium]|nr:deoxyhypusine synthase [Planctomycetota bacterium]
MTTKKELLKEKVEHLSLDTFDPVPLVDAFGKMAFQARNTHSAAQIYETMLRDKECAVILCLAGSLISAGLKKVFVQLIEANMVDAIVSTGANIVDQDFFEGLGFHHWRGTNFVDDNVLRELMIDRIYDTFIDEEDLRSCDDTVGRIAESLEPRAYSSREFIREMGRYLAKKGKNKESIVLAAYKRDVPIFCPAFSDCSAGFGLVHHQWHRGLKGEPVVSIDSAKDFLELTRVKLASKDTGLFMIGGGVPKNFAQDIVVAADVLGYENVAMHKYAVQITVADERDGALSGSTLKEASSWGKVSTAHEQMVFGEATVILPLVAGYAYHKQAAEGRKQRRFNKLLDTRLSAKKAAKA